MKEYRRVRAEINLDAIYFNMENMRCSVAEETRLCGVVKADGYGHGAVAVAKTIDPLVWGYAVATAEEGIILRSHGITKPILILGVTTPDCFEEVIAHDIHPAIFQLEKARQLSEAAGRMGKTASIHIKIDTGMNRIGMPAEEGSIQEIVQIGALPHIKIEGIFTHMATADEMDKSKAQAQAEQFTWLCDEVQRQGVDIPIRHCSNSAGIIDMPYVNMDMVRCGISLYGMYPSDEVNKRRLMLYPALSLISQVSYIKTVPAKTEIGYGGSYVTQRPTTLATIPVGYGDGYPRGLSNKGYVLIHGQKAPICGRVCMDQFMVDITDIDNVKEGDRVTLVGKDQGNMISVEELCSLFDGFHYEFVCDIGKRVPRVFYRHGEIVGTQDYFADPVQITL